MQLLPILGTGALIAAAAAATVTATQQDVPDIPLIGAPSGAVTATQSARQISLIPNARNDAFYAAITDRPLFQQSRRPNTPQTEVVATPEPEAPAPEAPAPPTIAPPPDLRLLGVISGGARSAALLSLAGDDAQWQNIGARIEGWTLDEIAADHVVLTENERAHRVELYQR